MLLYLHCFAGGRNGIWIIQLLRELPVTKKKFIGRDERPKSSYLVVHVLDMEQIKKLCKILDVLYGTVAIAVDLVRKSRVLYQQ
jgi:hypothetical protein